VQINQWIDHTYLKPVGTTKEIITLLEEAKKYHFKSVSVHPCFVKFAKEQLSDSDVLVCTVVGFPYGGNTVETKVFETLNAILNGADEIDMVLNISEVLSGNYNYILDEVNQIAKACQGHVLKVIIESGYLSVEEIIKVSETISKSEATFIKTSTRLGSTDTTAETVKLILDHAGDKLVASWYSGDSLEDFNKFIESGASRISTENGALLILGKSGSHNE